MASTQFFDKVTVVPVEWANDVNRIAYDVLKNPRNAADARQALGLGTLSQQQSNSVSITGGQLEAVIIGANQPRQAGFTRVTLTEPITEFSDNNAVVTKKYVDEKFISGSASATGVRSMAYQDSGAVNITGGTINNVNIGGSVPSNFGKFVSLDILSQGTNATSALLYGTVGTMAFQQSSNVNITGGTLSNIDATFDQLKVNAAPVNFNDAVNKLYVDTKDALALLKDGSNMLPQTTSPASVALPANVGLVRSLVQELTSTEVDGSSYRVSNSVPSGITSLMPKLVSFPALKAYNNLKGTVTNSNFTFNDDFDIVVADTTGIGSLVVTIGAPSSYVDQRAKFVGSVIPVGSGNVVTILLTGGSTFLDGSTTYVMHNNLESTQLVMFDANRWLIV